MVPALGLATSAQAATLPAQAGEPVEVCAHDTTDLASHSGVPLQDVAVSSKSAAILGGQPSALEQIRIAQSTSEVTPGFAVTSIDGPEATFIQSLAPAMGGTRSQASGCSLFVPPAAAEYGANDFLASKRLAVSRTSFDRDWQRVSRDHISARRYRKLIGNASSDHLSTLASVNSWVNQTIAFTEDRDLFSRSDFWAGAATTLRLRRGDCEDIALTKMGLLAAAGIPREDMILTIARDLVRNADHAVLVVRVEGRYYMLDNASDEVFDASGSHDYRPILSFGNDQAWLHGY